MTDLPRPGSAADDVIQVHPVNPHYFLFRGEPTVLIGSSEHYGAVINRDFDYVRYLETLARYGLNVTRIFTGQYRERPGPFSLKSPGFEIVENTLAPNPNAFVAPWPRSGEPGAGDGRNKFDLARWNEEFFERLHDFCRHASRHGIIVEVCLFSPYYVAGHGSYFWDISPFKIENNINGVGAVEGSDALSLDCGELLDVQEALVRKIVQELGSYDNVYYEICNEPVLGGVPHDWQAHIARLIRATDNGCPTRHLICQEVVDAKGDLTAPNEPEDLRLLGLESHAEHRVPEAQMLAYHIARPRAVLDNYDVGLPIGENEIVFVASDAGNRISAWRILLAGGAFRHGTDYSFVRGHEDGSFEVPSGGAGGGSDAVRRQFGFLHRFMQEMDFIAMEPARDILLSPLPEGAVLVGLEQPGICYALHISHELPSEGARPAPIDPAPQRVDLCLNLASGSYLARWIDTRTGAVAREDRVEGGRASLSSPVYCEDIALRIVPVR